MNAPGAQHLSHQMHATGTSNHGAAEKGFYHGDHSTPDGVPGAGGLVMMDKSGVVTSAGGLMPHNTSGSSI